MEYKPLTPLKNMAKLNASELQIIDQIAGWKAESPGFLNRATDTVAKPLGWLADKLTPENVKTSAGGVVETVVEKLQDFSQLTVDREEVLKATREFEIEAQTVLELKKATIHDLDHVAQSFIGDNSRMGAVTGVGTGLVGWPGLIADLPTLFMLAMRTIHQIGLCYGFDIEPVQPAEGESPEAVRAFEVEYMMRVFKVATAADKVQKQKSLAELKDFELGRADAVAVGSDFATRQVGKNAASYVSRIIIKEIVERTITKKAVGLVPGLGAVFSAGFNYVYLKDVGEAAYMLYRERFLQDKKGRSKVITVEID